MNVSTDGKRKERHNRELLLISGLLQSKGVKRLCMHHVQDAGMDRSLPLTFQGKWYDIAYVAPDGVIFMIEVMRVGTRFPSEWTPEMQKWLKHE